MTTEAAATPRNDGEAVEPGRQEHDPHQPPDEEQGPEGTEGDIPLPADYSDLLTAFDDAEGLDDAEARDVETGFDIDEDEEEGPEAPETLLDIGALMPAGAGDSEHDDEDAAGMDDAGPTGDLTGAELAALAGEAGSDPATSDSTLDAGSDDAEGAIEPLSELVNEELPGMDDGVDDPGTARTPELPLGDAVDLDVVDDDDLPRPSELPWVALPSPGTSPSSRSLHREPHHLVARLGGMVLAAGSRLTRLDDDGVPSVILEPLPAALSSIVSEPDGKTLLCATARGGLLRLRPTDGATEAEPVSAWREALPDGQTSTSLQLGGPTPSARPALLLLLENDGVLLESTDHGTTFRRVDLGGPVLSLSTGTPPLCVVETSRGIRSMRSEASGGFRALGEGWPVEAEGSKIVSDGAVVAVLARSDRKGAGVHVSADGGVTFRKAGSSSKATAVTVGRLGGRPSAFAALYAPVSGRATLVWIDAATGESLGIAHIDGDEDADGDPSRVTSLAWDPATETLWAATAGGLHRFRRPASA